MEWDITVNEKHHRVTATVTTNFVYILTLKVDGNEVLQVKGGNALKPQAFEIDGIPCSIMVTPDLFNPTPVLSVNGSYVGKSLNDISEKTKLTSLKLVLYLAIISLIMQIIRVMTQSQQYTAYTAILSICEPLFVMTNILGFFDTRHPFFSKVLRGYFLLATVIFIYSFFDNQPGIAGGFMTPIALLLVSASMPGLEKIPEPPKSNE